MEYFAKESSFSPEKWEIVVTVLKLLKKKGRDINAILPDEIWNGIPIGQYLEELRQMRGEGKLTEKELHILQELEVRLHYRERRWMYMYKRAKEFYLIHGHLQVRWSDDKDLCQWVGDQRKKYRNAVRIRPNGMVDSYSSHTEEQKKLLEEIDIDWDVSAFNKYYPLLVQFYNRRGNTDVSNPCWIDGHEIGHWVYAIRSGRGKINAEQKELLAKLNFEFKKKTNKERYIGGTSLPEQIVLFYFRKLYNDADKTNIDGFELDMYSEKYNADGKKGLAIEYDGLFTHGSKEQFHIDNKKDKMCEEKEIKLIRIREEGLEKTDSAINYFVPTKNYELLDITLKDIFRNELRMSDISIDIKRDYMEIEEIYLNLESVAINRHINELVKHVKEHHSFPPSNKKHSGLYGKVLLLRELKKGRRGRLTDKQIAILDSIGMIWKPNEYNWEVGFSHAKEFFNREKHLNVDHNYVSPDGYRLGNWIYNQRCRRTPEKEYRGKLLSEEQKKRLDEIGMIW